MILGIIPARSGSKGIPNKNIYPLCGKRLIDYTIKPALDSILDDVVVTTDSVSMMSHIYHPKYIMRPAFLASDNAKAIDTIRHCVYEYEEKWGEEVTEICLLQPTSPLRTMEDINDAISKYDLMKATSLYSGYKMGIKTSKKVYDKHKVKPHFQRNGAIFITSRELLDQNKLWDENVVEFTMPKSRSIDIDDYDDMYMAESLLMRRS